VWRWRPIDSRHEEIARWLEDGRELFGRMQEKLASLAKENEQLLNRLGEVEGALSRADQDGIRVRADRDQLLAAFNRLAYLVDQIRLSRRADT